MTEINFAQVAEQTLQAHNVGDNPDPTPTTTFINAPFAEHPEIKFRWFLTRDLTEDRPSIAPEDATDVISSDGKHLISIGMNPSVAKYFGPTKAGGDPTCARIVNALAGGFLPDVFYPASRITFINLVPIVNKKPTEAKSDWESLKAHHEALLTAHAELVEHILQWKDNVIVVPAFGVGLNRTDWRRDGFKEIFSLPKQLPDKESRLLSVKNNHHPRGWPAKEILDEAFTSAWEKLEELNAKIQGA